MRPCPVYSAIDECAVMRDCPTIFVMLRTGLFREDLACIARTCASWQRTRKRVKLLCGAVQVGGVDQLLELVETGVGISEHKTRSYPLAVYYGEDDTPEVFLFLPPACVKEL